MFHDSPQYLTKEKFEKLQAELQELTTNTLPSIAKRIDDAKQMGDLSENAEYHAAREEMAWAQSRVKEVEYILQHAELIQAGRSSLGIVQIGSRVVVKIEPDKTREYAIVGAQEADPLLGKISNESPIGEAFIGKKAGDMVEVRTPAGIQAYTILEVQ